MHADVCGRIRPRADVHGQLQAPTDACGCHADANGCHADAMRMPMDLLDPSNHHVICCWFFKSTMDELAHFADHFNIKFDEIGAG